MRRWLVLLAAVALVGCTVTRPTPQEVFDAHAAEREAASDEIRAGFAPYEAIGERVGASERVECTPGQHNWKRDDDFDVLCVVTVKEAFRIDGDTFREVADKVHAVQGCSAHEGESAMIMRDYWQMYEGKETVAFDGPYVPDYLPGYSLGCGDLSDLRVYGWSTLPVSGKDATQQQESALGDACAASATDSVCRFTGDTAAEIWADQEGKSGWIVYLGREQEYARV